MSISSLIFSTLAAFIVVGGGAIFVDGQAVGVDICACTPKQYEISFRFTMDCNSNVNTRGVAIDGTECLLRGGVPGVKVSTLVPVQVQTIEVLVLNSNTETLFQDSFVRTFTEGDTFQYTSTIAQSNNNMVIEPGDVPSFIQLKMVGINRFNQLVLNVNTIQFKNDCTIYPVFTEGLFIGWANFVSFLTCVCV